MNLFRLTLAFARHHGVATLCTTLAVGLAASLTLLVLRLEQAAAVEPMPASERWLVEQGPILILLSAGTVASTLYLTSAIHRRDHAMLRALGALPREVFAVVIGEALVQVVLGVLLGMAASRIILIFRLSSDIRPSFLTWSAYELLAMFAVILLGAFSALAPAWRAYRSDVATNLRPR